MVLVSWISQTILPLVLLSAVIAGQNELASAADMRSEAMYSDADAMLHEVVKLQNHLVAQDRVLGQLADRLARLEGR